MYASRLSFLLTLLNLVQFGFSDCSTPENYKIPSAGPLEHSFQPVHIFATVAGYQAWIGYIEKLETPIALHFTRLIDILGWNCAAIYSNEWKDALTEEDPFFHTPASVQVNGETVSLHNSDTRFLCMIHSWSTVVEDWTPLGKERLLAHLQDFQYPDLQPGYNSTVDSCFNLLDGTVDPDCLYNVAHSSCFTPSVIGSIVGRQVQEYGELIVDCYCRRSFG